MVYGEKKFASDKGLRYYLERPYTTELSDAACHAPLTIRKLSCGQMLSADLVQSLPHRLLTWVFCR